MGNFNIQTSSFMGCFNIVSKCRRFCSLTSRQLFYLLNSSDTTDMDTSGTLSLIFSEQTFLFSAVSRACYFRMLFHGMLFQGSWIPVLDHFHSVGKFQFAIVIHNKIQFMLFYLQCKSIDIFK